MVYLGHGTMLIATKDSNKYYTFAFNLEDLTLEKTQLLSKEELRNLVEKCQDDNELLLLKDHVEGLVIEKFGKNWV